MTALGRAIRKMEEVIVSVSVGVCYYSSGEKYNGEWVDGAKEGKGRG